MKNIAPELLSHLQQSVTTLATCFKITRDDGVVLGFTSLDRNLIIDNLIYQSTDSLLSSAIESTADFTPDNLDIQGILSHDFINETDLLAAIESGKVAAAALDVFDNEPNPRKDLLNNAKIATTPHIGAATLEAQDRIGSELADLIIGQFGKIV